MAEETPEQRFERLQNAVQAEILTAYPNPTRNGCPGDVVVKQVAARQELVKDAPWEHITHCSPCYGEFLSYKQEVRSKAKRQKRSRRIQLAAVTCLLVGLLIASRFWNGRRPEVVFDAELDLRHALLVFRDIPSAQSESTTPLNPPLTLRRGHLRLKIDLPETWEPGKYDVAFLSGARRQNIFTTSGDAKLSEESLVLSIDAQLNVPTGDYTISLRREGSAWKGYPVRVTNEN